MEIADRLRQIMVHYGLNAAELADKLKVQRSNISHLLTGRNKPSLDFLSKLINIIPQLNLRWLITGEGHFLISKESSTQEKTGSLNTSQKEMIAPLKEQMATTSSNEAIPEKADVKKDSMKKVTKVILIYNDNSFEVY